MPEEKRGARKKKKKKYHGELKEKQNYTKQHGAN